MIFQEEIEQAVADYAQKLIDQEKRAGRPLPKLDDFEAWADGLIESLIENKIQEVLAREVFRRVCEAK